MAHPTPRARRRLDHRELEQLLEVTRHLAAPFELSRLLAEVGAVACSVLHAERCSVWLLDAATGELVIEVSTDATRLRLPAGKGLAGACLQERQTINVPDCYADPRFDPAVDRRTGFRTRCSLSLPLMDERHEMVGVLQVLNRRHGVFDEADIALAEALAAQCAVALARTRMMEEHLRAERVRQELELARLVQTSSLPHALPRLPGYAMHATFLPAAETGGDTYDLALLADGHVLLLLADASGHGIAPALSVTQMQAMLRTALRLGASLEAAFRIVNDQLAETLPDGHFVTAFVGLLDPVTHRLRFISGGQSPILHYRAAEDGFEVHKATSFPMGAMPLPRERAAVQTELQPGDWLVLLSDGVFECEGAADVGQFGRARVEALLQAQPLQAPPELSARLLAALREFAAGTPQDDDITMVLLQRLPVAGASPVTELPSGDARVEG